MTKHILTAYVALALAAPAFAQERFDSADAAAQALIDATAKHDSARLAAIFGPQANAIQTSGNAAQDLAEQSEFSRLCGMTHRLIVDPRNPNRVILSVGDQDWPFPVPIIRSNGKWAFDASAGQDEMLARRVGAHEMDAIEISAGYVEAQKKYAEEARSNNGMFHYAPHMASANGGLVPLVPQALAEATWDGPQKPSKPYHGYYFRILDAQGPNAPGGAHNFRVRNTLMGGFGLVAWPAQYGVTGILTFIVNQDGEIYQKDIPPASNGAPIPITQYDPDPSWKPVN
jgi:Protein of unknown function (DUF2950)